MPATALSSSKSRPAARRPQRATVRRPAPLAAARGAGPARPRGRCHSLPSAQKTPDPDSYGVIWLDCCGRPVTDALNSLMELAAELEGDLNLLEHAPTYAVAMVRLPRASYARFRGALALAGGSFIESGETDPTAETVFIMSHGVLPSQA